MAYADQKMSSNRMMALGAVALIHILLGYALVTGLAGNILKKIIDPIKTVNIKEEAPPPDEPPPPPPKELEIPPFVPPPEVTIENQAPPPPTITTQNTVVPPPQPTYVAPAPAAVAAPPAPPSSPPTSATPKGRGNTISEDDYPEASKRAEEQGVTRVSYTVGTDGKATGCSVIASSGSPRLDERTCKLVESRFRFNPATRDGKPVTENKSQSVRWQLKDAR